MKGKTLVKMAALLFIMCIAMPVFASGGGGGSQQSGTMTIEWFNVASNFTGIQPGWFGKMIKDKFNIELNIIAPQVLGSTLFQTRSASGNLGDVVLLDSADFLDSITAGLIMDISPIIRNYPNLVTWTEQINAFNRGIPGAGTKIYGIPVEMTDTSPTSFSGMNVAISPWLPWDLYNSIGAPRLRNTNDLLDALAAIQRANPRGIDGQPAYAFSLWPDWDGTSCEIINQTVKMYGVEVRGSILMDYNSRMKPLTDDAGEYRKMLRFFYDANQRGLVDPDSGTMQWDQVVVKMQNRRIYMWWYDWQRGFWNSPARGNSRENFIPIPVEDMLHFAEGDSYFGSGRVIGVGSKVDNAKRDKIMTFLDWLAGPEGANVLHNGIEGFNYVVLPDGSFNRTPAGEVAFSENPPVPAEWGGGGWNDGNSWINQWIVAGSANNPRNNYPYAYDFWPAEIQKALTTTQREWTAKYGGATQVEYLKAHNQIGIVPRVNVVIPSDPTDIQLIRSQCGDIVKDTSWRMMLARNEAEFNQLWNTMKTQLNGLGWERLVQFDMQKYQAIVTARNAALR